MRFRRAIVVLIALFVPFGPGAAVPDEPADELRALVSWVEGEPTVLTGGTRNREEARPHTARPLDFVPGGSLLRLGAGERIELLCSTEHLVPLEGPSEARLDAALCRKGRRQPAGSFRAASPERGRLTEVGDVLALVMRTRADEIRAVPLLLSPRNTALLDPTPELVWTATPGALEYEVQVLGPPPVGSRTIVLEPPEADCGSVRDGWPGVEVCSVEWSEIVGSTGVPTSGVYLDVGSRFALAAPPRGEDPPPRVRSLASEDRRTVLERLRELPDPEESPFLHAILATRTLVERKLYHAARERLLRALDVRDAPALRVTLGDLYMEIRLPERAAASYERASENAADPAVLGAALYGLGRAELALDRFDAARSHFERAAEQFSNAGLGHERAAAVEAAAKARKSIQGH